MIINTGSYFGVGQSMGWKEIVDSRSENGLLTPDCAVNATDYSDRAGYWGLPGSTLGHKHKHMGVR